MLEPLFESLKPLLLLLLAFLKDRFGLGALVGGKEGEDPFAGLCYQFVVLLFEVLGPLAYFLAALVGFQKRDIPKSYADRLPRRLREALRISLACMRLSWIFCRTREDDAIPGIDITLDDSRVRLALPASWMENHPLTIADLEYEERALQTTGLHLEITYTNHD